MTRDESRCDALESLRSQLSPTDANSSLPSLALLPPQRDDRVDSGRAISGNPDGDRGDAGDGRGSGDQRDRVGTGHAEELTPNQAATRQRHGEPSVRRRGGRNPYRDWLETLDVKPRRRAAAISATPLGRRHQHRSHAPDPRAVIADDSSGACRTTRREARPSGSPALRAVPGPRTRASR